MKHARGQKGFAHVHGEVHLCCIYQFDNLEEIADRIKDKLFDPGSVFEFNAWLIGKSRLICKHTKQCEIRWKRDGGNAGPIQATME